MAAALSTRLGPGEIRLVRSCPRNEAKSDSDATMRYETIHASLLAAPPYTGLSYACGRPEKVKAIVLDGEGHSITHNLHEAIQNLRHESGWFWVDAISINQSDDGEKSEQVHQMTNIYMHAQRVLVWLGPGTDPSNALMKCFNDLGPKALEAGIFEMNEAAIKQWPNFQGDRRLVDVKNALERLMQMLRNQANTSAFSVQEFVGMTNRAWFHRAWTVQEHAVAKNVVFACGDQRVLGDNFAASFQLGTIWIITRVRQMKPSTSLVWAIIQLVLFRLRNGPSLFEALRNAQIPNARAAITLGERRKFLRRDPKMTLKSYLTRAFTLDSTGGIGCTEKADRVFAFLGMCSDRHDLELLGIRPDYRRPWTDVYVDVSRALLLRGNLDILSIRRRYDNDDGNSAGRGSHWPSWAVDWSVPLQKPLCGYSEESLFNAATHLAVDVCETGDRNVLSFQGFQVDVLTENLGTIWLPAKSKRSTSDPPDARPLGTTNEEERANVSREGVTTAAQSTIEDARIRLANPQSTLMGDNTVASEGQDASRSTPAANGHLHGGTAQAVDRDGEKSEPDSPSFNYVGAHVLLTEVESYLTNSQLYSTEQATLAECRIPIHDFEYSTLGQTQRATAACAKGHVEMKTFAGTQDSVRGAPPMGPDFASYHNMMESVYGRRPFRSEQGLVGLCPAKAERGDLLCVLAGMSGPVILRRVQEGITVGASAKGEECYILVGEAYAYGIMDGELWHLEPPLTARRFKIM